MVIGHFDYFLHDYLPVHDYDDFLHEYLHEHLSII